MRWLTIIAFLIALAAPAAAQGVRFGVKGGVLASNYFDTDSALTSETRRFVAGPSIEFEFRERARIEFDVLYRRMNYTHTLRCGLPCFTPPSTITDVAVTEVTGSSWDFPILAKFLSEGDNGNAFASAGFVVRAIGPIDARGTTTLINLVDFSSTNGVFEPEHPDRAFAGLVVGGGFEAGPGRVRIVPELRYTRWLKNTFGEALLERNQFEFLVGITF